MAELRAVLFDLDGTLVDSNEHHVEVWARVFADASHDVPRERIRGQIGKGGDKLIPALLPNLPDGAVEKLSKAHGELFKAEYIDQVRPFADAHALLARIHDGGRKVVLASSASKEEGDRYAELLGARDLIAVATTIDDVGQSKPAPDIFAVALKKAGVPADAAVAVGDSPFDMEAARKAGMAALAVRSGGFSDDALTEAGAAAIYDDVAALLRAYGGSPLA